ncbi:MAG TPA: TetR/AcrR family transcriptional regulator [Slackia equolifaciens]|uniref:TetR/AcrR family transcriptional regulator n=1 Tax=Slackia equolifaciens TaxID=498718 RepID=A0A9D2UYX6_9ACTN|nr:TetR/AcrR family transcriptional regulator [Slackia equolifaciens]
MERREEIVACARELFEEKGLSKTSVQNIADRLGVARSLFYHYFPSKEELTSAVLDTYVEEFIESLRAWNAQRRTGDIDHALATVVALTRKELFDCESAHKPFRRALATHENAALYLAFVNRVAERVTSYIMDTTVEDYRRLHSVNIQHPYETIYTLILGLVGYLRQHPDVDDEVIKDIIAETLHLDTTQADQRQPDQKQ